MLSLCSAEGLKAPRTKRDPASGRPARILVVEDERHIARLLDFVLRKAGYEVAVSHSAEQALIEIQNGEPDALVLDLVLPGMTGLELLRTIRAIPYSFTCVVIVLSSNLFREPDKTLIEVGASAQCSKPIAPSTLLRKLSNLGVHPPAPADV